jgi:WD40 repeat protein
MGDSIDEASRTAVSSEAHEVRVFLCYRRTDGGWHAEWLNRHLSGFVYADSEGKQCRILSYYDKTAPGVADWKKLHFPSLQSSEALILICTPGIALDLSKRSHPDWVYEELRWWSRHRRTAPIVIDATGEGHRWLPRLVTRKWPSINRIDLIREHAEAAADSDDMIFADRTRQRIIGAIRESERATVFEDLERFRKLYKRLIVALLFVGLLLLGAVAAGLLALKFYQEAAQQQTLAEQRLAESLSAQGDAQAASGNRDEAASRYLEAREILSRIEKSTFSKDLKLWSLLRRTPLIVQTFDIAKGIESFHISPDSRRAVAVTPEGLVFVNLLTGEKIRDLRGCGNGATTTALSASGAFVFFGGEDGSLTFCSTQQGSLVWKVAGHHAPVTVIAVGSNESQLLSGAEDGTIVLWNVENGRVVRKFRGHHGRVSALRFSLDDRRALSSGEDAKVKLWNLLDGKALAEFMDERASSTVAFGEDTSEFVSAAGSDVKFWRLGTDRRPFATEYVGGPSSRPVLSASGRFWLSQGGQENPTERGYPLDQYDAKLQLVDEANAKAIQLWCLPDSKPHGFDLHNPTLLRRFERYATTCVGAAFSLDEKTLVIADQSGRIELWDLSAPDDVRTHLRYSAQRPDYSLDDRLILLAGRSAAEISDVETGQRLRLFELDSSVVSSVALSSTQGTAILGLTDGSLCYLDVLSGTRAATLRAHNGEVTGIAVAPDGSLVATAGKDGKVKIWDGSTKFALRTLSADARWPLSIVFSPNGKLIAAGGDSTVRVWDASTGHLVAQFASKFVCGPVFSNLSSRLAWSTPDQLIKVVDLQSGEPVLTLQSADGWSIRGIGFLPGEQYLVTLGGERSLDVWDLKTRQILERFPEHYEQGRWLVVAHNGLQVLSDEGSPHSLSWDFTPRLAKYFANLESAKQVTAALQATDRPFDQLRSLGEWYAFRGRYHWAVELLEAARNAGVYPQPSVDLARCYFLAGHRSQALTQFRELQKAGQVDHTFLALWVQFLESQVTEPK